MKHNIKLKVNINPMRCVNYCKNTGASKVNSVLNRYQWNRHVQNNMNE